MVSNSITIQTLRVIYHAGYRPFKLFYINIYNISNYYLQAGVFENAIRQAIVMIFYGIFRNNKLFYLKRLYNHLCFHISLEVQSHFPSDNYKKFSHFVSSARLEVLVIFFLQFNSYILR